MWIDVVDDVNTSHSINMSEVIMVRWEKSGDAKIFTRIPALIITVTDPRYVKDVWRATHLEAIHHAGK